MSMNRSRVYIRFDRYDVRPPCIKVGDDISKELLGSNYLDFHNGLEDHGFCLCDTIFKRHRACHLESNLRGVYFVIASVVKIRLDIYNRIISKHAGCHCFPDPFLDRRNILFRDGIAPDTIDKLQAAAFLSRLEFYTDMSILAVTAGLADKFAFGLDRYRDSLFISNLGRTNFSSDPEFGKQAVNDHLKVKFSHA